MAACTHSGWIGNACTVSADFVDRLPAGSAAITNPIDLGSVVLFPLSAR